jgi:hypothetical protein
LNPGGRREDSVHIVFTLNAATNDADNDVTGDDATSDDAANDADDDEREHPGRDGGG